MKAYKFETTVRKNGVIQIPEMAGFADQRVEVFVVINPLDMQEIQQRHTLTNFVNKWRGFLKGFDADELKSQYLKEKHG